MLILLSPAKTLDYETSPLTHEATQARLTARSHQLINTLKSLDAEALGKLMQLSPKLAELNYKRYQDYQLTYNEQNSRQAILAFTGDVYQGMELAKWLSDDFATAQRQIRILSGLYGVLRPLDRIQPHRLEMGTALKNSDGNTLYDFWGSMITELLNEDLENSGSDLIVNLASNEYFSSVKTQELKGQLVTPVFKDEKNGMFKVISFYVKKARGMMADFIVRTRAESVEALKEFNCNGYQYNAENSGNHTLTFLRSKA